MSNFGAMTLTDAGKNIAARFIAGEIPLNFSKFALGSGTAPEGTDLKTLTDLVERQQDIGIATVVRENESGKVTVRGNYTNASIFEAYSAKELGLYVLDPDSGSSVLFGYFVDSIPDTIPPEGIRALTDIISVTLVLNGSGDITATFDPNEFATIKDIEDRLKTFYDRMIDIDDVIDALHPVGSIYISTTDTDPAELMPNTKWELIAPGRMLIGAGEAASGARYEAGKTGGEEKHKITVNEMPAHTHRLTIQTNNISGGFNVWKFDPCTSGVFSTRYLGGGANSKDGGGDSMWRVEMNISNILTGTSLANSGGGASHNNMPPYLVVYIWQRTE